MKRFLVLMAVLALFLSGCTVQPREVTIVDVKDAQKEEHYRSATLNYTFSNGLRCTVQRGVRLGGVSCDFKMFEEANASLEIENEIISIEYTELELMMPSDDRICVLLSDVQIGGIDCYFIPR